MAACDCPNGGHCGCVHDYPVFRHFNNGAFDEARIRAINTGDPGYFDELVQFLMQNGYNKCIAPV